MPESVERVTPEAEPPAESSVPKGSSVLRASALVRTLGRWLLRHGSDLAFLGLALGVLAAVAYDAFSVRMATGTHTGDFWEHSATLHALIQNPWHPANPHLVSPDSSPRFVPLFLLVALVARALDLDAIDAMGVVALVHSVLFLGAVFVFFRTYFRARRASLYGLIVMFGSWIYAWHFSNVYQLSIFFSVVSYPSTAALALSLLGFTQTTRLLRGSARERFGLALLGLCLALLLVTHALTAMLGLTGAALLCLTEPAVPWRRRVRVLCAIGLGVLAAEAWPYFSTFSVLRGGPPQETSWVMDLMDSPGAEPSGRRHFFYKQKDLLLALGYALIGVPVCLLLLVLRKHLFIVLGALAMATPFVVNYYVSLPLGHRFILLAVFFLQAALVWLLLSLPGFVGRCLRSVAKSWPERLATLGVLAFLAWISHPHVTRTLTRFEKTMRNHPRGVSSTLRLARTVGSAAGQGAVVLADAETSWALPTFGPKVVSLLHENPLVHDQDRRNADVRYFFSGRSNDRRRAELLRSYGVTHVLLRGRQERALESFLTSHGQRRRLPGGYVLYTLAPNAAN